MGTGVGVPATRTLDRVEGCLAREAASNLCERCTLAFSLSMSQCIGRRGSGREDSGVLIHLGRNLFRRRVHGVFERVRGEVPAEDAGGFDVDDCVFLRGGGRLVRAEHDVGRVEGQVVELRVGG